MCGICGELRFDGDRPSPHELSAMRERLRHRGPDSDGLFVAPEGNAGLAFRRLRIIDLTANASQPMANEDGSVRLVFNGEIYNYRQLRSRLIARGHHFRSHSDTETIVHLYEEKGADCIADLDGMFAIAIWDERSRRLTLARDRAGKKPLFYYRDDRVLAFASEIKSLLQRRDLNIDLDPEAVPYYFIHGYVPGPSTFYRKVRQLPPGCVMTITESGEAALRRYWQLQFPPSGAVPPVSVASAAKRVRELVTAAVERRLESDVPLGAFLSGGIDSTIVVGLMASAMKEPVRTFSIGFEGDSAYDETAYARQAAERFGTIHTEFRVAPSAVDLIDTLLWHHDGPFGDSSAVPTYIVSKLTREHVTVVLTGDGGDELFAGYMRFYAGLISERLPKAAGAAANGMLSLLPTPLSDRHWLAKARRFARPLGRPLDERVASWNSFFFDDLRSLLRSDFAAALQPIEPLKHLAADSPDRERWSPLSRLLYANFSSYLADDLLVKTDRCTMANSLEARSPLLDRELIEYVAGLPDDLKIRGRHLKFILRHAFADLLPADIARRGKMGFGVPLGTWFRGELRERVRELLLAPDAKYRSMLDADYVAETVGRHLSGKANLGHQLWSLMCFERWLQLLPEWRRGSVLVKEPGLANLHTH